MSLAGDPVAVGEPDRPVRRVEQQRADQHHDHQAAHAQIQAGGRSAGTHDDARPSGEDRASYAEKGVSRRRRGGRRRHRRATTVVTAVVTAVVVGPPWSSPGSTSHRDRRGRRPAPPHRCAGRGPPGRRAPWPVVAAVVVARLRLTAVPARDRPCVIGTVTLVVDAVVGTVPLMLRAAVAAAVVAGLAARRGARRPTVVDADVRGVAGAGCRRSLPNAAQAPIAGVATRTPAAARTVMRFIRCS